MPERFWACVSSRPDMYAFLAHSDEDGNYYRVYVNQDHSVPRLSLCNEWSNPDFLLSRRHSVANNRRTLAAAYIREKSATIAMRSLPGTENDSAT